MCSNSTELNRQSCLYHSAIQKQPSKRSKVRVHRLTRRKRKCDNKVEKEMKMKMKNWKLYLENRSIIEENEKLRKKATLLHQENLALMSELQNVTSLMSTTASPAPSSFIFFTNTKY